jgi:hypothetical protein
MDKRETKESGLNTFAIALLAVVICAVAVLLMPAQAGTEDSAAAPAATSDYLPAQIANQAKEIVPEPMMYQP